MNKSLDASAMQPLSIVRGYFSQLGLNIDLEKSSKTLTIRSVPANL
jgi:hypothetical protein